MTDRTMTFKVSDARALADRLFGLATSRLAFEPDPVRRDMKSAARLLWWLLRDFAPGEVITLPIDDTEGDHQ
jgi:hypothetical protein